MPVANNGAPEPTPQAIRLCREYGMQKRTNAQDNDMFVCGMQTVDADDLMHGIVISS